MDTAVLIHPWGCTLGDRLNAYYLFNSLGNPTETALALSRIVFSGLLERHPRLKIWSAHGGGYLASCMVRADHAWAVRSDAHTTTEPPSALLRRTFVDSLVYTAEQLRHLVSSMGGPGRPLGGSRLRPGHDRRHSGGNAVRLLGPITAAEAAHSRSRTGEVEHMEEDA